MTLYLSNPPDAVLGEAALLGCLSLPASRRAASQRRLTHGGAGMATGHPIPLRYGWDYGWVAAGTAAPSAPLGVWLALAN